MKDRIQAIAVYSDNQIQKMKFNGFPYLYCLLCVCGPVLSVTLFALTDKILLSVLPLALLIFLPVALITSSRKRKMIENYIKRSEDIISKSDNSSFDDLLKELKEKHDNDHSFMRYTLFQIYSRMIRLIAMDIKIDTGEKSIISSIRKEIKQYDTSEGLIRTIHLYYLENFTNVLMETRMAVGPEGREPFPAQEEEFLKNFIDYFGIDVSDIKAFLSDMKEKIVKMALEFITQGNTAALFDFIDTRELRWGQYNFFMKDLLAGIYTVMLPIVSADKFVDEEEKKVIEYLNAKIIKYTHSDSGIHKIGIDFLKKYTSGLSESDPSIQKELDFMKSFVDQFHITEAEAGYYFGVAREYRDLRKIESEGLQKIVPSLNSIQESDMCFYESPVNIMIKEHSGAYSGAKDLKNIYEFKVKNKGQLFVTANTVQLSMKSLHVIRIEEIRAVHFNTARDIIELKMAGEMGSFYLSTPENRKTLAIINKIKDMK